MLEGKWLAVTGTREDILAKHAPIKAKLGLYITHYDFTGIVQGICSGVDARAARIAKGYYGIDVHSVVPQGWERPGSHMDWGWQSFSTTHELMPQGTSLLDRDLRVLERSTRALLAFPRYDEHDYRSRRSGTWYTIRRAREQGFMVEVVVLTDTRWNPDPEPPNVTRDAVKSARERGRERVRARYERG